MVFPTVYFRERWQERVNQMVPTVNELNQALSNSIRLQAQRDLFTPRGRRYRVLAMYWSPEQGVVFKVDHKSRKLVSVFSPAMAGDDKGGYYEIE